MTTRYSLCYFKDLATRWLLLNKLKKYRKQCNNREGRAYFPLMCPRINNIITELKKWSSHSLDNLSDCLICVPEKFQASSTGFKPITSAMSMQCPNQLSYKATQMWAGQFVGLMCSHERNDEWKKCLVKCVWEMNNEEMTFTLAGQSQVHIWDNRWHCPTSMRIISSIHLSTTFHKTFLSLNIITRTLLLLSLLLLLLLLILVILIIPWLCIMWHEETVMLHW